MRRRWEMLLWFLAAAVGLGLAAAVHADTLASVALVAAVGIVLGMGFAAWQRFSR